MTPEIKKYCNQYFYTDVEPFEVVKVISPKIVEIRPMKAIPVRLPQDFHAGGFSGHYADNWNQSYTYESIPDAPTERVHWSEKKQQWTGRRRMSDKPIYFYDYNF
jgi:hypothetical protein